MIRYTFRFYNGDEVYSEILNEKNDSCMRKIINKKFIKEKSFFLPCQPSYYMNSKNINFIKREEIND